jgi:hypothetical protein
MFGFGKSKKQSEVGATESAPKGRGRGGEGSDEARQQQGSATPNRVGERSRGEVDVRAILQANEQLKAQLQAQVTSQSNLSSPRRLLKLKLNTTPA